MPDVKEVNLYKLLIIIKKNKGFFIFNLFSITIIILIISFIIPQKYTSYSMILPPEESFDPLLYGFSGIGQGTSSSLTQALLSQSTVSELWITILRSRTVYLTTFTHLQLWKVFNIDKTENAIEMLNSLISIDITPEGVIYLSVTTENPKLSFDIANELLSNLDKINKELYQTYASNRRMFIEKRLNTVQDSLKKIEYKILEFTQNNKIINVEIETGPFLTAFSTLKAEEILAEVELASLGSNLTSLHPQKQVLEARLNTLRSKINQLESGGGEGYGIGFSIPLESLPSISMEYARLKRNYLILNTVFELLIQEVERAKIAEQKDSPTLKIVDKPSFPDEKSYPKRSIFAFVGLFLGLSVGVLLALLQDYFNNKLKNEVFREKCSDLLLKW